MDTALDDVLENDLRKEYVNELDLYDNEIDGYCVCLLLALK